MDLNALIEEVRAIPALMPPDLSRFTPAEQEKWEPFLAMYEVVSRLRNALAELEPEAETVRKPRPVAVEGRGPGPEPEDTAELLDEPEAFWGEIVTETGSGAYTFKEKSLTDGTTWADTSDGRSGTVYEINNVTGIVVGRIIRVVMGYDTSGDAQYVCAVSVSVTAIRYDATSHKFQYKNTGDTAWTDITALTECDDT